MFRDILVCLLVIILFIIYNIRKLNKIERTLYGTNTSLITKIRKVKEVKRKLKEYSDYKILFTFFYHSFNASSSFKNTIILYSPWIAIICNNRFVEIRDILLHTIGHEEAHHKGDFIDSADKKLFSDVEQRVIKWITEGHHDFYGFKKYRSFYSVSKIEIMNQKANIKKQLSNINKLSDKDKSLYPSWDLRIKYIEKGKFDRKLLDDIVSDMGLCTDDSKELLNKLLEFYGEISLK